MELETIYRGAEANGIPVMIHTGTMSIFPAARNKFGDPIYLDDVAVDFSQAENPDGARRATDLDADSILSASAHKNVHLDIAGFLEVLLKYFPRLEEIAHKTLFGTDWPSPGIPDTNKISTSSRRLRCRIQ